ncbi:MAG: S-layer homology domain-containing protein [Anaeromicrobium sp.]|uniref:S-layer homology domain-containing protein n=1 Tax=Anaeromicrobium sp. TaxID=1929132 RepID=UPI0025DC84CF|nr:S-layer homology domain-containing protein [Anaeromicrobium sp.]MCT4593738.1 S-layer homology domain-containing protein [Anaeromicrobium sp.]
MKKIGILVILISLILTNTTFAMDKYTGIKEYEGLYNNLNFSDIKNSPYKKSIYKLASLSVIRKKSSNKFYPSKNISKEEVITMLVRIAGKEEEVQGIIGKKKLNGNDELEAYLDVAKKINLITKDEAKDILYVSDEEKYKIEDKINEEVKKNPNYTEDEIVDLEEKIRRDMEHKYTWGKLTNREEVAIWIGRIMGLNKINGSNRQYVYNLKDHSKIKAENISLIERVLQLKIIEPIDGYFKPSSPIRRDEMAVILDKISKKIFELRGYVVKEGVIDSKEEFVVPVENLITGEIRGENNYVYTTRDEKGEYNKISTVGDSGYIVYDKYNGIIGLAPNLEEYDYIEYWINDKKNVVYVEVK